MTAMKTIVMRHRIRAGQLAVAEARIAATTALVLAEPGCVLRLVGPAADDPLSLVSVTTWRDAEALAAWRAKRAAATPAAGPSPYEALEETEIDTADHNRGPALSSL